TSTNTRIGATALSACTNRSPSSATDLAAAGRKSASKAPATKPTTIWATRLVRLMNRMIRGISDIGASRSLAETAPTQPVPAVEKRRMVRRSPDHAQRCAATGRQKAGRWRPARPKGARKAPLYEGSHLEARHQIVQ